MPCHAVTESATPTTAIVDSTTTSNHTDNTLSEIATEATVTENPPDVSHNTTANASTDTYAEMEDEDEATDEGWESNSEDTESESEDTESESEDSESESEDSFGGASSLNSDLSFLNQGSSTRQLWIWHRVLMTVSWGILVPLAVGSSMLRNTLCHAPEVWLTVHLSLNMFAITCMVVSFGIAVYATSANTTDGEDSKRRTIGLVIFLLAFMQAASGMMRPSGPKKPATRVGGTQRRRGDGRDGE